MVDGQTVNGVHIVRHRRWIPKNHTSADSFYNPEPTSQIHQTNRKIAGTESFSDSSFFANVPDCPRNEFEKRRLIAPEIFDPHPSAADCIYLERSKKSTAQRPLFLGLYLLSYLHRSRPTTRNPHPSATGCIYLERSKKSTVHRPLFLDLLSYLHRSRPTTRNPHH